MGWTSPMTPWFETREDAFLAMRTGEVTSS
jgi:hypothetical protein